MCYPCVSTAVVKERRGICVIFGEEVFNLTIDFVRCMFSGKLFHSVVVDGENDCL